MGKIKLTKEQRIEAYEFAIKEVNNDELNQTITCICSPLRGYLYQKLSKSVLLKNVPRLFIELYKRKPYSAISDDSFWWDMYDYKVRKKVLKECIAEAKKSKD